MDDENFEDALKKWLKGETKSIRRRAIFNYNGGRAILTLKLHTIVDGHKGPAQADVEVHGTGATLYEAFTNATTILHRVTLGQ